jgi:hypothetical protein
MQRAVVPPAQLRLDGHLIAAVIAKEGLALLITKSLQRNWIRYRHQVSS